MAKKGYLVAIAIIVIGLVTIMIIVKKPKTAEEYFKTGLTQYKKL